MTPTPSAPLSAQPANFCPNCGTKVSGTKFCTNCGAKLEPMLAAPASPPTVAAPAKPAARKTAAAKTAAPAKAATAKPAAAHPAPASPAVNGEKLLEDVAAHGLFGAMAGAVSGREGWRRGGDGDWLSKARWAWPGARGRGGCGRHATAPAPRPARPPHPPLPPTGLVVPFVGLVGGAAGRGGGREACCGGGGERRALLRMRSGRKKKKKRACS